MTRTAAATTALFRRTAPLCLLVVAAACGGHDDGGGPDPTMERGRSTTPAEHAPLPATSWVAHARVPEIAVYERPGATTPSRTLDNPNESGAPLVFLVDAPDADTDWLPVHLPVRPNGTKGWVRAADVSLTHHTYRITVELAAHKLALTKDGQPLIEAPIAVGTRDTPTPGGIYYIKELLQPPDPDGAYGPYAYGLSGFSTELTSFNGGTGVIGIHGTNAPETIGNDVSHGCIRVTNDIITQLARILPLGTPVEILA